MSPERGFLFPRNRAWLLAPAAFREEGIRKGSDSAPGNGQRASLRKLSVDGNGTEGIGEKKVDRLLIFPPAATTPAREKVARIPERASRHFSSRKGRNREEYPRLKLLPGMNFLLREDSSSSAYPRTPSSAGLFPSLRRADFLPSPPCTARELMVVPGKLTRRAVFAP